MKVKLVHAENKYTFVYCRTKYYHCAEQTEHEQNKKIPEKYRMKINTFSIQYDSLCGAFYQNEILMNISKIFDWIQRFDFETCDFW